MRERIIQEIYEYLTENRLDAEFRRLAVKADERLKGIVADHELDELDKLLWEISYSSFFLGANAVLDFISGEEVA